ncbi:MAG: Rieske (2Fe-2S) protein [Planctomycetota bacterium]|jgi:nitrite reductase/ring-hydroxylating ferredoxin subunit
MTRFCASEDLAAGSVLSRVLDGQSVAVARFEDGSLCAFGALCPHQQADLSHGILEDGGITCADHLWHFELPSGRCTSIPGARLPAYEVHEADGAVHVEVPEP